MKRMIKVLLILAATVAAVAALAITAGATELKTGIAIVEANGGLRLRSQASTSSDVLSTAHNGDNVVVIRQVGNWYLVNYNLKIGYMHSDYITFKERENIELGYGSVDPYLANIRSGPSTSSGLVDQAGSGAKVFIFGFNCGWYKVKYNGQIGYIRSDLVTLLEKPYCNSGSSSSGSSYSSATGYDNSYSSGSSSSSSTSLGQQIAVFGMQYVGYPYVYGGTSPSGFDCSGFVQYIYRQFGYSINRTATAQLANGYYVSYDSLMPGDLVFFGSGFPCRHVHRRRRIRPRGQFPLRRQDLEPLGKLVRSPVHRRPPHRRIKQNILPCAGQAPAQVFLQLISRISHGIMKQI